MIASVMDETAQVKACLIYYNKYPKEIDATNEKNPALVREAVEAKLSGPVRTA